MAENQKNQQGNGNGKTYWDVNDVTITGRLGVDPELRYTPNGTAVCQLRVAIAEGQRTSWVTVVTFGKVAESVANYLKKGRKILIKGRLHTNEWTTQDGQKRSRVEVYASRVRFMDTPRREEIPPEGVEEEEEIPF